MAFAMRSCMARLIGASETCVFDAVMNSSADPMDWLENNER